MKIANIAKVDHDSTVPTVEKMVEWNKLKFVISLVLLVFIHLHRKKNSFCFEDLVMLFSKLKSKLDDFFLSS